MQRAAIGRVHGDLADPASRVGGVDFGVERHAHPIAQCLGSTVVEVRVELGQPGMAVLRHQCQHRSHREFALVHSGRMRDRTQHVDRALVHMGDHACQVLRPEGVFTHHLRQRVRGGMRVAAARMELEGGFDRGPAPHAADVVGTIAVAESVHQLCRVGIAGHAGRQPLRTFEDLRGAGETIARQPRRHQAGAGCMGRVQLFGIGGGAQELPEPGRLGAGGPEGMLHLRGVQPQQVARRCRGSERAGRTRGVEYLVVRAAQKLSDADADFVARHRRRQQARAACADRLRQRQRHRKYHRRRMEHRAVVDIVLLGHMRRRGVDHRRKVRAGLAAAHQHFGRTGARPHRRSKAGDGFDRPCALARQCGAKPVDQQVFGLAQHRWRNVLEVQAGGKFSELGSAHGRHSSDRTLK